MQHTVVSPEVIDVLKQHAEKPLPYIEDDYTAGLNEGWREHARKLCSLLNIVYHKDIDNE